jgi:hypothetical protein
MSHIPAYTAQQPQQIDQLFQAALLHHLIFDCWIEKNQPLQEIPLL